MQWGYEGNDESGTTAKINNKANKCSNSYYVLHVHILGKNVFCNYDNLEWHHQIINYINSRPFKSILFKERCEDIKRGRQCLLLVQMVIFTKEIVYCFMELFTEIKAFLLDIISGVAKVGVQMLRVPLIL